MARVIYLLDTNIISEPLAAKPNPSVMEKIRAHGTDLAITSVTWQELLYGMLLLPAGHRREQIKDYLIDRVGPSLPILGFDAAAARWQAEQRARLRSMGQTPAYPDSQIAAIAAVNQCVLVTRNVADFEAYLKAGLVIENWFDNQ
jgi:tRNA(fMet)-specific endonuclease VapC